MTQHNTYPVYMTLRMSYLNPTHGRAGVASSRTKLLESKFRRLRLYLFQLYLRGNLSLGMPCTALQPTSKPGQPQTEIELYAFNIYIKVFVIT